jgi:hypothetical protein
MISPQPDEDGAGHRVQPVLDSRVGQDPGIDQRLKNHGEGEVHGDQDHPVTDRQTAQVGPAELAGDHFLGTPDESGIGADG